MKFSEKIKTLREEQGYSLDELAERTELPALVISAFENSLNYPKTSKTYTKLAEVLGTTVEFLKAE